MKTDRRVLRTKKFITDALLNLLMEKQFNDITIQEITDTANVGRATFYLHYNSKEDCLMQLLTKGFDSLVAKLENSIEVSNRDLVMITEEVFKHSAKNRKLYLALLSDSQSAFLLNDVKKYVTSKMLKHNARIIDQNPINGQAISHYLSGALINLLIWWLEEEPEISAREAAQMYTSMAQFGLSQFQLTSIN